MINDMVNHPPHYQAQDGSGIECIDSIKASMSGEEFTGYLKGNAMKYVHRVGKKFNSVEDIDKAIWYLKKLRDHLVEIEKEE